MGIRSNAREKVAALAAAGLDNRQIAARLHYSVVYVYRVRLALEEEAARAKAPAPDTRALALERGRRLALAKVAAGEWVLPREVEP